MITPDNEPEAFRMPEGYSTDLHVIELTNKELDVLIFTLSKELGYIQQAAELFGLVGPGQTLGLNEEAREDLNPLLERLLDKSESISR